ncbi:restriction endonuclease subunit S [Segatella copri]|uniref:restriction endonuclease subunit S n=1 Tax=Segatella copri TaxID=165179 RepID=UPI00222EC2A1|nr:restriction endonuclease subunit S [Segatella copri]MCW4081894.1 restriction endonuclease subunit S [Segatella copri]
MFATGEVKCIDEEVPFEIPKGWEWCRLNDLALYRKGPFGSSLTKSMFVAKSNQSVKVYEQKNAIQKDFRLGDYYISKEKFEAMQSFIVKPNDIIVSCAGTIGETYLLPLDAPVGIINQALMRVTLFDLSMAEYWQMYFAYMLLNEAQMKGAGSAIKNIPPFEYLKAVLVPVPPLSEQSRLVERYNLLLSLIAKYESEADKLNCLNLNIYDKLKKSVLQEAIQGKLVQQIAEEGTAQKLLEQIKTEKLKLVKEGKLKKSALNDSVIFRGDDNKYYEQIGKKCLDITEQIPFEIPSNWEWCRVRNVSNSYIGLTYKPTDIDEKGIIVLRSCNIRNGKLALDDIVRVSSSISEKLLIEENDIIICARNGSKRLVGKSALIRNLTEPMTFGAFMAICKTPIYEYMFAYLQSDLFFGQLRDVSNTTTINQLTQNKFNDFLIPIPPVKEQERIAFKISQLFQELR